MIEVRAHSTPDGKRDRNLIHACKRLSYKMIADAGGITFHTVNPHLKKIDEKLQVHSATEALSKVFSTERRLG